MAEAKSRSTLGRSILAVFAGILINVIPALLIDELFHALGVYPAQPPMEDPGANALALSYRVLFAIGGAWATARLAPKAPMRHALILGAIGTVMATAGVIVSTQVHMGPLWYPVALALLTMPCVWIGGRLAGRAEPLRSHRHPGGSGISFLFRR